MGFYWEGPRCGRGEMGGSEVECWELSGTQGLKERVLSVFIEATLPWQGDRAHILMNQGNLKMCCS